MIQIDRTTASRLLAKTIAFANCGKEQEAEEHAQALMFYLRQCGISFELVEAEIEGQKARGR